MADIAKYGTPSMCSPTPASNQQLAGDLFAGEDIGAADACYIKSTDGKVYRCVHVTGATAPDAPSKCRGYAFAAAKSGQPVTLIWDVDFAYASPSVPLTPGQDIWLSATAGAINNAAPGTHAAIQPIGFAVDTTRVHLDRTRY